MSSAEVQIMAGKTQVLNYPKKKAQITAATGFEMICQHRGPNNMKMKGLGFDESSRRKNFKFLLFYQVKN